MGTVRWWRSAIAHLEKRPLLLDRQAVRREPDPLFLAVGIALSRVAARALPSVLGPRRGHLMLAGIPAERDAQVRVVSVIECPLSDLRAHRRVVLAVEVGVAKLVGVRRV